MEAENFVLVGVLLAVSLLVFAAIYISIRGELFEYEEDAACASQIQVHAALQEVTKEMVATQIACPTRVVEGEYDEESAKEAIAEEMARCWNVWGEGQYSLFGEDMGTFCHVCATIDVAGAEEIRGLSTWLAEKEYKNGQTYLEYLAGVSSGDYFEEVEMYEIDTEGNRGQRYEFKDSTEMSIPTGERLGVIFYYVKGQTVFDRVVKGTAGNPWLGLAGGAAAGLGIAAGAVSVVGAGVVTGTALIVTGTSGGGVIGTLTAFSLRPETDYVSFVIVRPLTRASISELGCMYAPAGNPQAT